jgi:hypothetical protein
MPIPTIVFGILLSTLYGAIYHLLRGGNTKTMLILILLAWIGFWLGDTLGWYMGWSFAGVGNLNAGMGTVLSLTFMLIGDLVMRLARAAKTA